MAQRAAEVPAAVASASQVVSAAAPRYSHATAQPCKRPAELLACSCLPRATHPVQSTGKGRRAESRSVSDPEPESLAGAPCPRRVQPLPSAGPRATIHHRVLTGKTPFGIFVVVFIQVKLFDLRSPCLPNGLVVCLEADLDGQSQFEVLDDSD